MRCAKFRKYLIPYAEGSLPPQLLERVERHVTACGSCAQELSSLSQAVEALRQADYPAMEPAPDLRSRVMAQIARVPVRRPWWQASRLQTYSAAAAGLLLFAIVGTTMWPLFTQSRQAPPRRGVEQVAPAEGTPVRPGLKEGFSPDRKVRTAPVEPGTLSVEKAAKAAPGEPAVGAYREAGAAPKSRSPETGVAFDFEPGIDAAKIAEGSRGEKKLPSAPGVELYAGGKPKAPPAAPTDSLDAAGLASKTSAAEHQRKMAQKYDHATERIKDSTPEPPGPAGPPAPREVADLVGGIGNVAPVREGEEADVRFGTSAQHDVLALELKLKEFPTSVTVLRELLANYREAGRSEDEYAVAERLTELDPENAGCWLARAQAAERAEMPATARACYRRAVELGLKDADLEHAKSRLKALEEKPKK